MEDNDERKVDRLKWCLDVMNNISHRWISHRACRDTRHVQFFPILRRYEKLVDSESSLHKVRRRHLRSASLPSSRFNRRAERVEEDLGCL